MVLRGRHDAAPSGRHPFGLSTPASGWLRRALSRADARASSGARIMARRLESVVRSRTVTGVTRPGSPPRAARSLHAPMPRVIPRPETHARRDRTSSSSVTTSRARARGRRARCYVERVVLVSDDAIREAQRRLWNEVRVFAEPGGAAALAALLSGAAVSEPGEHVVVLVCGANGDLSAIASPVRRAPDLRRTRP
jgi:threonine synthase